jgi:diaminopimelate decarboxylase
VDHFVYKNGLLHAEDVPLDALARSIGTPFYCYSDATLVRHFRIFSDALKGMDPLICYAVKANDALAIIKTLAREGSGADVVSGGEVRRALAAGVPPEKIVFSGVGKTREEMAFALAQDIFQFNVESEAELQALSKTASMQRKRARIALRVNPDVGSGTHAKISTGHKESKFGVPIAEAPALYAKAGSLAGIEVQGVSVHIGSQLMRLAPFEGAFALLAELVRQLRAGGHAISTLDLGGGLGIPYTAKDAPPSPVAYADIVKKAVQGLGCRLIFEPGRVLVGNAGILVTQVIYIKKNGGRNIVIVDAGMNDLIRPTLYNAYHHIVPVKLGDGHSREGGGDKEECDIVGPVCETGDIFAQGRPFHLPKAGDILAFRSAGAYGATMASTYNSRPLLAEAMVKGKDYAIIRPRQTYEELLSRDKLPGWL